MKIPTGAAIVLEEVDSTQEYLRAELLAGKDTSIVRTNYQSLGKGRFDRVWMSEPGESLLLSIAFRDYVGHPAPHLIGMAVSLAASFAFSTRIQWPNDLVVGSRKIGGILTELMPCEDGLVPVVGIGVNLTQVLFPREIAHRATSLKLALGEDFNPEEAQASLLEQIKNLPEPSSWGSLEELWRAQDQTMGKLYRHPELGLVEALSVGEEGELQALHDGKKISVYAADALFGLQ